MISGGSARRCARSWEVEALRDGRLRGQAAESLARHLRTCAACEAERRNLAELERDFVQLPPPRLDALAGRRIRQRVLGDHNAWLLRQEQPTAPQRRGTRWLAAALAVLVSAGAWRLFAPHRVGVAQGPRVDVRASAGARWSRRAAPHDVRVVLDAGELELTIGRDEPRDRVLIILPDGEIEDLGTVLTVAAHDGATDVVRVEQGSVVLRLRKHAPLALSAGQAWRRDVPPLASKTPAARARGFASEPTVSAPPVTSARVPANHSHAAPPLGRHGAGTGARLSAEAPTPPTPNSANASAAAAEDDAYLRIVELVREGPLERARAAAKDYLLRFPNGFRRVEVLDIATRDAP